MSVFGESIDFLVSLGIYDVVLPFLLVFTLIFAIMEKTKILGTEINPVDGKEYTKRNLDAMAAFVIAFFVVASSQLVAAINKTISQVFILLLLVICFLMVAGTFHQQKKEGYFLDPKSGYYKAFMAITFIAILAIFINALGWFDVVYKFLKDNWNESYVAAIIFVAAIIGFMMWITKNEAPTSEEKKES